MAASGDVVLTRPRSYTPVIGSGTYYLEAGAMGYEGNLGTYQSGRLEALVGSDLVADNSSTGYSVALGRVLDTEIEFSGDVDWVYAIWRDLPGGPAWRRRLRPAHGMLRVISPDGLEVASDTDSVRASTRSWCSPPTRPVVTTSRPGPTMTNGTYVLGCVSYIAVSRTRWRRSSSTSMAWGSMTSQTATPVPGSRSA